MNEKLIWQSQNGLAAERTLESANKYVAGPDLKG